MNTFSTTSNSLRRMCRLTLAIFAIIGVNPLMAEVTAPLRSPLDGIAVVDCAPSIPDLQDTCTLRIPPLTERGAMRQVKSGAAGSGFEFIRDNDKRFPKGIQLSATMIVIDQTPGPGSQRIKHFGLEKELINLILKGLPENELIAAYAFDEVGSLRPLAGFTSSTDKVTASVDALKTAGVNTHIASNLMDAIKVFADQEDILFRNIIVISDGEEEGLVVTDEVHKAAIKAKVAVSTLGMFWRPVGSAEIGRAKDYMESRLTTPDFGVAAGVMLNAPEAARKVVEDFIQRYATASLRSGLIVPVGGGFETDLVVETIAPQIGNPGAKKTIEHRVHFKPSKPAGNETKPKDKASPTPEPSDTATDGPKSGYEDLLWGYPRIWIYGAAAAAGSLLMMVIVALVIRMGRKRRLSQVSSRVEGPVISPSLRADDTTGFNPPLRPLATLVRDDTRERFSVTATGGTIGRAPSNEVVISDESVSRLHAELKLAGGALTLTDAGSLNGTFVNGKKITGGAVRVKVGDSLGFGDVITKLVNP